MPAGVRVNITSAAIISALNTPGGAVHEWRDQVGQGIMAEAIGLSPVNNPLNAMHRGGEVGTYKAGWSWDRRGSSGHHVVARVRNSANHAIFVEWGRGGSSKMQIFSMASVVIKDVEHAGAIVRVGGPDALPERIRVGRRMRPLTRGERAFNERISKLPTKIGNRTHDRPGEHVLGRATVAVLGAQGISARVR